MKHGVCHVAIENHVEALARRELTHRDHELIERRFESPAGHAIGVVDHINVIDRSHLVSKKT